MSDSLLIRFYGIRGTGLPDRSSGVHVMAFGRSMAASRGFSKTHHVTHLGTEPSPEDDRSIECLGSNRETP